MKEQFIENKINSMSLSDKIGQLLMIDYRNVLHMDSDFEKCLQKYKPGGFILFKSNIKSYNQVQNLIKQIKTIGLITPIISVDQEGGRVQRLNENVGFKNYPPMLELSQYSDLEKIYEVGYQMGSELKFIGIDMTMAPVLDIFSNSKNKVISNRAFGINPDEVSKGALTFANALKAAEIIAVGKHFPGHGDTNTDSHIDLPVINKNLQELNSFELCPFKAAIDNLMPGLLVAHISLPNVTNDFLPASLSYKMIEMLLRNKLDYKGIVIPDSLKMKALTKNFSEEQIYVNCFTAGNDILLMPQNIQTAFETIYNAVNDGIISKKRLDLSVKRILSLKFDYNFFAEEYQNFTYERCGRTLKRTK